MVTMFRWSGRFLGLAILAMYAVGIASIFVRGADDAKAKARARAALALATVTSPTAAADPPPMTAARAAAKAALNACGDLCPCGQCECEPGKCECCKGEKGKPMPPAVPPTESTKPERMTYAELVKAVAKLKDGETLTLYVGQPAAASAAGRVIELKDSIPNEEQRIGVWKCWSERGEPKMISAQPKDGGVRVVTDGRYLDRYPDGSLYWCVPCNRGR